MNLRGRIPVEPLDDEQVVRVERAVVAGYADAMARGRAHGSRWYLPALAAAAAAAVVAAVLVWKLRPAHPAELPVAVAPAPVRVEAAAAGSRVDLGDATIDVAPGGAFAVTRPDGGVLIALDRGRVDLAVLSRKGKAPLVVRAGDVDVVVVGTQFSVERGDQVTVEVREGVVRVERGGGEVRVAAGERWSAPSVIAAGTPMPAVMAIAVADADTVPSDDIEMTSGDDGGPELHGHDTAVPTVSGGKERGGRPPRGTHDAPESGSGSGSDSGSGSGQTLDLISAVRREDVAEPYDSGLTGDAAIADYLNNWLKKSAKEQLVAKYALAHLYRAQGKNREALGWLTAYSTQGPNGPEIESVLWMRIQLSCKHPIDEACRKAANTYMNRFPSSTRAELALQLSNSIGQ